MINWWLVQEEVWKRKLNSWCTAIHFHRRQIRAWQISRNSFSSTIPLHWSYFFLFWKIVSIWPLAMVNLLCSPITLDVGMRCGNLHFWVKLNHHWSWWGKAISFNSYFNYSPDINVSMYCAFSVQWTLCSVRCMKHLRTVTEKYIA